MSDTPKSSAGEKFKEIAATGLERMSRAAEEINQMTAERRRQVPETFFANALLPIIRGWVRRDPNIEPGVWLNVADGLNNEIDVIDPDGQVLFTVPPAFQDLALATTPPQGRIVTPHHLVTQQETMLSNGDMRGVMEIESGLEETFKPRPEDEQKAKYILMYMDIYRYYSLPMEELLGPNAAELLAQQGQKTPTAQAEVKEADEDGDDYIY